NLFSGVALHEFLSQTGVRELQGGCQTTAPTRTPPVSDNSITNNRVRQNGTTADTLAGGITMFNIGVGDACAATNNTITGNTIAANIGNGLFVAATSHNNTINNNAVTSNTRDGIAVQGPTFGNTFTNVGPSVFDVTSPDLPPYVPGNPADFRVLSGSGSGDVTTQVVAIDPVINNVGGVNTNPVDTSTSGCELSDYTNNPDWNAGDIALVQRGTCTFAQKVDTAIQAGASAVVLFNEGQAGRQSDNFGSAGGVRTIPVLSTTYQIGLQLVNLDASGTVTAHIVTNTTNVSFQASSGAHDNTLMSNRGTGNAFHDGADYNPNCDANVWSGNIFGTVNQACVKANGGTGTIVP
ncbi:MAG: right-handed parallel beta-helix repeat-containing protein, partial [Actinobacteria bacterium]|nr:right-handed parallel beta-helix repeat-containing protein [Actinomycetota bacterium]